MGNQKKALVILALLIVLLTGIWLIFRPQGTAGSKEILVTVVLEDGTQQEHTIITDAEFLRQALEEANLISGEDGPFGLFVISVGGVEANESLQQWWCFTKDGESLSTGVDSIPVADGDRFEITLITGY